MASSPERDDSQAFLALLVGNRHRLVAYLSKLVVHAADVEDLFQRTSLVLWKKRRDFDPNADFFRWACGVAFNEVRNHLTVQRRDRLHFDANLVGLLAAEAADEGDQSSRRLDALRTCLSKLSDTQRRLVQRCYSGGTTITQVAASLGRTGDALHKQLARLREKLRTCVQSRLAREGAGQ